MGKIRFASRLARVCIASLIVVCCVGVIDATAASAGGFSVRPGEIDPNDAATRAYFKPLLKPGAGATLHVIVTNLGVASLHLLVNSVDGLTGQTSGSVYANRQDPVVKAGAWVAPSAHEIIVAPGAVRSVPFTIHVPTNATPGDHLAGIAFENALVASSGGSFAVKQIMREVVGIQIQVPGAASTHVGVGALALQSLPGTSFASVIVNLSNDGTLLCKPSLTVTLGGADGRARTATRKLDTILPGDTIAYPLPWPDSLSPGTYAARASTAECGPSAKTAEVPLALGVPLNGTQHATHVPARPFRVPLFSLALAVALAIAGLFFGLLIGKRRRRSDEPTAPSPTEPSPVAPARVRLGLFSWQRKMPARADSQAFERLHEHAQRAGSIEPGVSAPQSARIGAGESATPSEQQSFWP
jgi:hypothetical protein